MILSWIRIPCTRAHRLLSERLDRAIAPGDLWRLRLHVMVCAMCARFESQIEFMRLAIRKFGD
ncbi:MAG: zf-HC2 domain-containing protein [Burkholderiaceae bacterium]